VNPSGAYPSPSKVRVASFTSSSSSSTTSTHWPSPRGRASSWFELRDGYEVYFVADAIGGVSLVAHESAVQRMIQAGATPISVLGLACELQRD
jgi:hypothetical protein